MQFYTYLYTDPIDGTPRYVGKGCNDRVHKHKMLKTQLGNLIRKRTKQGYNVEPVVTYHASELTALAMERFWIAVYGRLDQQTGTLFNLTEGGEGSAGYIFTEEVKQKMSTTRTGRPGRKWSDEQKLAKSLARKGTKLGPMSDEAKQKKADAAIARYADPEYRKKFCGPKSEEHRAKIAANNRARANQT